MLVLSRERDESIVIDDKIVVTVVEVRRGVVRLGIAAPREIPVHRKEVWEQIQKDKAKPEPEHGEPAASH